MPSDGPAASTSSTVHSSSAHIATTCWASTSSGALGRCSDSMAPVRMRSTTTAVGTRSPRNVGKSTPRRHRTDLVAGAPHPLQPAATRRCLDLDHEVDRAHVDAEFEAGVATTAGSLPALSSASIRLRSSLLTDPWCARASDRRGPQRGAPDCAWIWAGQAKSS